MIDELIANARADGRVTMIRAHAKNGKLFEKVYEPRGFLVHPPEKASRWVHIPIRLTLARTKYSKRARESEYCGDGDELAPRVKRVSHTNCNPSECRRDSDDCQAGRGDGESHGHENHQPSCLRIGDRSHSKPSADGDESQDDRDGAAVRDPQPMQANGECDERKEPRDSTTCAAPCKVEAQSVVRPTVHK